MQLTFYSVCVITLFTALNFVMKIATDYAGGNKK